MKTVHLLSLINAKKNLTDTAFQKFLDHYDIKIKEDELLDLGSLVSQLLNERILTQTQVLDILQRFYVGFTINQIGKEFDLLRFGKNNVINIELKRKNTGAKMTKQLVRNKYYLGFLNKEILNFTYVAEEEKLYQLDEDESLIEVNLKILVSELLNQDLIEIENIHNEFDPSNYLISPFNSTPEFIEDKYFLTENQEVIKKNILDIDVKAGPCFVSLEGRAGTGKTLLTYDIAKECRRMEKEVLIFHVGSLNPGHMRLKNNYGWNISSISKYSHYDFKDYDLIIVDETQRMSTIQVDHFLSKAEDTDTKYIFAYDYQQCLATWEINSNIPQYIEQKVAPAHFELTEKIRTNKEIASFIKNFFDLSKKSPKQQYSNIHVEYFSTSLAVQKELEVLKSQDWKVINYTPSKFDRYPTDRYQNDFEDSAHAVVGQEFDKVVVVLDEHFYYDNQKKLSTRGWNTTPYYHPTKMLFQMVTRTRKKLHIIILKNESVLSECLKILHP
ncbi:DNA/RNA helicase domain-containing protein [Priestia megaterium]|uniref:DNA/RNA helicase domain-containing protein n=1 Tax=Priestia megaterium TaxID=1404 RepID=UPI001C529DF6|nr:DNA/RNA helicase domain-containing protein [Priestia megaterium]MBW0933543.1 DUF2075 domain-containing protein [Priestia megaterium]